MAHIPEYQMRKQFESDVITAYHLRHEWVRQGLGLLIMLTELCQYSLPVCLFQDGWVVTFTINCSSKEISSIDYLMITNVELKIKESLLKNSSDTACPLLYFIFHSLPYQEKWTSLTYSQVISNLLVKLGCSKKLWETLAP